MSKSNCKNSIKEVIKNAYELETEIIERFKKTGWNIIEPKLDQNYRFDLEIGYDGDSYGYVEILLNRNDNNYLLNKINQARYIIDKLSPKLFIVTDGVEYHISFNKKPFETIHYLPKPNSFYIQNNLLNKECGGDEK